MDLDEALDIRSGGMPRGAAVLVTDEVDASGAWLIAHLLRRALVSAAEGSDDADASRRARAGGSSASRPPGRVCLVTACCVHIVSYFVICVFVFVVFVVFVVVFDKGRGMEVLCGMIA